MFIYSKDDESLVFALKPIFSYCRLHDIVVFNVLGADVYQRVGYVWALFGFVCSKP